MTAGEDREKILDKLRKLNAMAESAAELGSEHEAQARGTQLDDGSGRGRSRGRSAADAVDLNGKALEGAGKSAPRIGA